MKQFIIALFTILSLAVSSKAVETGTVTSWKIKDSYLTNGKVRFSSSTEKRTIEFEVTYQKFSRPPAAGGGYYSPNFLVALHIETGSTITFLTGTYACSSSEFGTGNSVTKTYTATLDASKFSSTSSPIGLVFSVDGVSKGPMDYGFGWEINAGTTPPPPQPTLSNELIPIYEYLGDEQKAHYFTTSRALDGNTWWKMDGIKMMGYNTQVTGTVPIYRFNKAIPYDYAYMMDNGIANTGGWNSGAIAFYAFSTQVPGTAPVYQYYNTVYNRHTLAIEQSLLNYLNNIPEWRNDGILFYTYPKTPLLANTPLPIYEYLGDGLKSHYFTLSREKDEASGFQLNGQKFKAFNTQVAGTVPMYFFRNDDSKDYVLWGNNELANTGGWDSGVIAFYVYPSQQPGTIPVYAFYNIPDRKHLVTADQALINSLNSNSAWRNDGITFYAIPN